MVTRSDSLLVFQRERVRRSHRLDLIGIAPMGIKNMLVPIDLDNCPLREDAVIVYTLSGLGDTVYSYRETLAGDALDIREFLQFGDVLPRGDFGKRVAAVTSTGAFDDD